MPSQRDAVVTSDEIRALDAQYQPFPGFSQWVEASVRVRDWQELALMLQDMRETAEKGVFDKAISFALRAAALDTGAIEGLYQVDRGFTFSVAMQAATWEAEADERDTNIRRFFDAQLRTYELVLDAVTSQTPISEAWLRTLHEELCSPQETYRVHTPVGVQDQPLPRGEYKRYPNHVLRQNGTAFAYAPVDQTPPEMHRLMKELRAQEFEEAHSVLQASYAHYAFVKIHPFADGNGRVARALASLYLYKADSIPLVVFADQRDSYFRALNDTDTGQLQSFVNFVFDRGIDTFLIQIERLKPVSAPPVKESAAALKRLYEMRHGLRHQELDDAAYALVDAVQGEIERQLSQIEFPAEVSYGLQVGGIGYKSQDDAYRPPFKDQGRLIILNFHSDTPASAKVQVHFQVYVSKTEHERGELFLQSMDLSESFYARIREVIPKQTKVFEIRMSTWVERMLNEAVALLEEKATEALHNPSL